MPDTEQQPTNPHDAVSAMLQDVITGAPPADDKPADKVKIDEKPPEVDALDEVSKLLADQDTEDTHTGGEADADRDDDGGRSKPESLAELAEAAGIKIEDLYKLTIPLRDGSEPVTLGSMKDQLAKAQNLDLLAVEIEDRRTEFENGMIRARQELSEVVSLLPEVPPALIERARAAHIDTLDKERTALLVVKPEWADDKVFARAQDDILEAVADYGFSRSDLDLVIDHRLTKLLHDFAGLKKRVAAANARVKEIRDAHPKGGKRVSETAQRKRSRDVAAEKAKQGSTGDKVREVGNILLGEQTAG